MQVSANYSSMSLSFASETTKTALSVPAAPSESSGVTDRVGLSAAALVAQSGSLSMSGTASGKKGADLGFSVELDYEHASLATASVQVESDSTGSSVSSQTSAGEATNTNFSFTMMSASEDSAHLNDEVSKVSKEIRPEVKEFLSAAGMKGGWGQMNRLLRSIA